jgi:N-acetyl-beta-hexosaminidase
MVEVQVSKFEFASPEWIAALRVLLDKYTAAEPDLELSICEVFTNVPKHLDKHGDGTIAWHCRLKGGKVAVFEETAIQEADVRSESDYDFILDVARKVYSPEAMPEVQAYMAKGAETGKTKSTSQNPTKVPASFTSMHNDLAVRTL